MRDACAAERHQMPYGRACPAPVVAVDVHHVRDLPRAARGAARAAVVAPAGPPAEHGGHPGVVDEAGQRVVEVQGEDERAVDMASGEVPGHARVVVPALGEQQHQLVVVGGQFLADAAQLQREEGVGEDPGLGLGDDDGDGVVPPGDKTAGGLVGDVPQLRDGLPYPLGQRLAHPVTAVDHPRHRGPGHSGPRGHGLQRGTRHCLGHFGTLLIGGCRSG